MNNFLAINILPITQIQAEIVDYSPELASFCELLEEKLEGRNPKEGSEGSIDEFILCPRN